MAKKKMYSFVVFFFKMTPKTKCLYSKEFEFLIKSVTYFLPVSNLKLKLNISLNLILLLTYNLLFLNCLV